jgi:hypothetical protein
MSAIINEWVGTYIDALKGMFWNQMLRVQRDINVCLVFKEAKQENPYIFKF